MKKYLSISLFLAAVVPTYALAQAKLSILPSQGTYTIGDTFSVLVVLNSGGTAVNAGEAQINFDNSRLEVAGIGYSQSIFNLWTADPTYSNSGGVIKFSGGLPNPGYNGIRGNILRITFRAKNTGTTPVDFVSASILANNGKGSNIADSLNGAVFTIVSTNLKRPATNVSLPIQTFKTADISVPIPTITKWSKSLQSGDILTIEGLGYPMYKVNIVIQKNAGEPLDEYTYAAPDGKFLFTYPVSLEAGYYQVWARNITDSGTAGGFSDPVSVTVSQPSSLRINNFAISYGAIIVILIIVILGIIASGFSFWLKYKKWIHAYRAQMASAEHIVHSSFETLRNGLGAYIGYLVSSKSSAGIKRKEKKTKEELDRELQNLEKKIERNIDNI